MVGCGLNDDIRRADGRADKCEPRPVEDKRLAGMNDDIVGIIRLRDPQNAVEALHLETLPIMNMEDLMSFEMVPGCAAW